MNTDAESKSLGWWIRIDKAGVLLHLVGTVAVISLILQDAKKYATPRPIFLACMEGVSLLFHVGYLQGNRVIPRWRKIDYPNTAKWLEYSLTAALGVLALIPPEPFDHCDAYAATLVGIVSAGVLQQQAGKHLDVYAFKGNPEKHFGPIAAMYVGAWMWQIGEYVLVWHLSDVRNAQHRFMVLLPYFIFYGLFGLLSLKRLVEAWTRKDAESHLLRYQFEAAYSLLGTVSKITLLATTLFHIFGLKDNAHWVGLSTTIVGLGIITYIGKEIKQINYKNSKPSVLF